METANSPMQIVGRVVHQETLIGRASVGTAKVVVNVVIVGKAENQAIELAAETGAVVESVVDEAGGGEAQATGSSGARRVA